MNHVERRAFIAPIVAAILVLSLLIGGSLYVRELIQSAFIRAAYVRVTRDLTYRVLKYQLDEETGVRGFAATGAPLFLQPYEEARAPFERALANLRLHVTGPVLRVLSPDVEALAATNAEWLKTVANPLLSHARNPLTIEKRGKELVDRMRAHVDRIDAFLLQREGRIADDSQASIDSFGILIGIAVLVILVVAFILGRQQVALTAKAAAERIRAERREREAERLAVAYRAEKRIADTLQQAFLQRSLPTQPAFNFSATYVPAAEEAKVGGDWYDALALQRDRVFFAIGDVTGHGIDAAVTMSHVRQSIIMAAMFDPDPATILTRVSLELFSEKKPLVTAIVGYADSSSYEFIYASAGHPPPLLIEPNRPPRFLDFGSLPLGALQDVAYTTNCVQSVPGSTLVLYTDGAIEHSRNVLEGEALFLAAAEQASHEANVNYAAFMYREIFTNRSAGDDIAILTIGFSRKGEKQTPIPVDVPDSFLIGSP